MSIATGRDIIFSEDKRCEEKPTNDSSQKRATAQTTRHAKTERRKELMNVYRIILLAVFGAMTIVGFSVMAADKYKASHGLWRISEKALFLVAIFLGGLGSTIGMFACRHKTRHWYFVVFFPIFAVIETVGVAVAFYYLGAL